MATAQGGGRRSKPGSRLHSGGESRLVARPPRGARSRGVPGRTRADDHRRRPAVIVIDLARLDPAASSARPGSSTAISSPTWSRCPWPVGCPTCWALAGSSWARSWRSPSGSFLAGAAQSLDQLIAARLVQAVGGGTLVPVGTAAAAHLFGGHARPRALGAIGALTFLGMAAGPFAGAALLGAIHAESALAAAGFVAGGPVDFLTPSWRWVFYINVPIGLVALAFAWAASAGWETPRQATAWTCSGRRRSASGWRCPARRPDAAGQRVGRHDPRSGRADRDRPPARRGLLGLASTVLAGCAATTRSSTPGCSAARVRLRRARLTADRLRLRDRDRRRRRVRRPGPLRRTDRAAARARVAGRRRRPSGRSLSGFAVRLLSLRLVTVVGLVASTAGLVAMAGWTPVDVDRGSPAGRSASSASASG